MPFWINHEEDPHNDSSASVNDSSLCSRSILCHAHSKANTETYRAHQYKLKNQNPRIVHPLPQSEDSVFNSSIRAVFLRFTWNHLQNDQNECIERCTKHTFPRHQFEWMSLVLSKNQFIHHINSAINKLPAQSD